VKVDDIFVIVVDVEDVEATAFVDVIDDVVEVDCSAVV